MQFSKRLDRFGEEIFAALNNRRMELEQQGMKIYNMSVGTPDFKTPEHIKKALAEAAMDDNNWKYSLRDLPELLEAVCEYYKKRFDVELTPDMVMTVYGSQEGMGHLGMALCDEGDVVLLPDPCYPVFAAGSLMAGAIPYYYPLVAEHDFLPYVKDIPEEVAKKAKYMVVSLPSNPVGSIATPGLYEEIVAFARKYVILIIHDNAYSDIIFDGAHGGSFWCLGRDCFLRSAANALFLFLWMVWTFVFAGIGTGIFGGHCAGLSAARCGRACCYAFPCAGWGNTVPRGGQRRFRDGQDSRRRSR